MIMRSTKSTVIHSLSCLNCDSRISATMNTCEMIAVVIGRRNSISQRELSTPHTSKYAAFATRSTSLATMITNAATCRITTAQSAAGWHQEVASKRVKRVSMVEATNKNGLLAAMPFTLINPAHCRCHKTVIKRVWQDMIDERGTRGARTRSFVGRHAFSSRRSEHNPWRIREDDARVAHVRSPS